MANRIKLPGILGAAAEQLGVSVLAKEAGTNTRTLYNWATNRSATPAIPALRLAEVCQRLRLKPLLYQMPGGGEKDCIASTPQGWLYMPLSGNGAHRYQSPVDDPQPAHPDLVQEAPEFGWPWLGSGRGRVVPVCLDLDTAFALKTLLDEAQATKTLPENAGVDDLMAYVAERLEEGLRRPGSWEGQMVASLFGT